MCYYLNSDLIPQFWSIKTVLLESLFIFKNT